MKLKFIKWMWQGNAKKDGVLFFYIFEAEDGRKLTFNCR